VISVSVCLTVGVFVRVHMSKLYQIFRACCMRPCLGLLCISGFMYDVMFSRDRLLAGNAFLIGEV